MEKTIVIILGYFVGYMVYLLAKTNIPLALGAIGAYVFMIWWNTD